MRRARRFRPAFRHYGQVGNLRPGLLKRGGALASPALIGGQLLAFWVSLVIPLS